MVDLKDFMASDRSIYSKSWIPSPWAVLKWGLSQVGVGVPASYDLSGGRLRSGNLVVVAALEDRWKQVQQTREKGPQGLTDRILSREAFVQEVNAITRQQLSEQDIAVFLRYLSRDKQVLSYDDSTVKFKAPNINTQQIEPITQEDHHIASLKLLITNLTSQVTTLQSRISTLQTTAQEAVKQHNKATALSALRSKKLAERNLSSRSATLHQLEEVYTKIEAAVDQVQVVRAMEASAGVLKSLNHQVGGVERVADVLDQLTEEMAKVDEVTGVIAEPLDAKTVLDEGEVDEELESLEREEREKLQRAEAEEMRRRLAELENLEREKERLRVISEREKERKIQETLQQQSQSEKEAQNAKFDEELSSSIEKLQTLDLHVRQKQEEAKDGEGKGTNVSRTLEAGIQSQSQRLPEPAS
jgi:charged multivesicular body protein 7